MTRYCTLGEMLDALRDLPDETQFRVLQLSHPGERGWADPDVTLILTLGALRAGIQDLA